jgi:hypothetical protein
MRDDRAAWSAASNNSLVYSIALEKADVPVRRDKRDPRSTILEPPHAR